MNQTITHNGYSLPREEYCTLKALEAQQRFPKEEFTPQMIEKMLSVCETNGEWEDETTHAQDILLEETCRDLEATEGSVKLEAQELEVVTEEKWSPNSQEAAMIERIRTASMESGAFSELRKKFDFSKGLRQLTPIEGAVITPFDYADALGVGVRMADAGRFLACEAVSHLEAYGTFSNVLEQAAAIFRVGYSTFANWNRTAQRVPLEYRETVPFTIAQEIACAKYDSDPQKNQEAITDLLQQAQVGGWNSEETRAAVKMRQGKPAKTTKKEEEFEFLVIFNGNHYLSDAYPPVEEGMEVINLKTKEYLTQEGKLEFLPLEVRL